MTSNATLAPQFSGAQPASVFQRAARGLACLIVLTLLACSGYRSYREAQIAERHGNWDQAVLHYLELVDQYPGNISYKAGLLRSKIKASQEHFDRAKKLHAVGSLEQALREYQQTLQLDPSNQYALVEYQKVVQALGEAQGGASMSIDELTDEFPYRLTTGRHLDAYNTGVQTDGYRSPLRRERRSGAMLDVSPEDAAHLGVADRDRVTVTSRRGALEADVRVHDGLRPGLVFMALHYPDEADVNQLTIEAWDPKSGTAEFKATAVRIERADAAPVPHEDDAAEGMRV
jgi:anaerobic selenocysteine-containing dehydrogenase